MLVLELIDEVARLPVPTRPIDFRPPASIGRPLMSFRMHDQRENGKGRGPEGAALDLQGKNAPLERERGRFSLF